MTVIASPADVAALLLQLRLSKGWTVDKFASEVGISHAHASLVSSGKRTPHLPKLISILDALGYDLVAVKRK